MLLSFLICLLLVYGPLAYQASQPKQISSGVISSRILKKLGQVMRVDPRLLEDIETPKIEKRIRLRSAPASTLSAVHGCGQMLPTG